METQAVDFSDMDDLDTADIRGSDMNTPTMLEAGANWAANNSGSQQRVKKLGARDVPRDALRFAACGKCGGTGRWRRATYMSGLINRSCFQCNGTGNGLSLAPTAVRARERKIESDQRVIQERANAVAKFVTDNADVIAWWDANPNFSFAQSLKAGFVKYGSLTPNQLAAAKKCIAGTAERNAVRETERAARAVDISGEGFTKLIAHFNTARASGLKNPALVYDGVCFKLAKKYPGQLYVTAGKAFESDYYGRVDANGKFDPTRAVSPEKLEAIKAIGADPIAEAIAYGKKTGTCACCGAELTNAISIEYGIGPVCREKWGM